MDGNRPGRNGEGGESSVGAQPIKRTHHFDVLHVFLTRTKNKIIPRIPPLQNNTLPSQTLHNPKDHSRWDSPTSLPMLVSPVSSLSSSSMRLWTQVFFEQSRDAKTDGDSVLNSWLTTRSYIVGYVFLPYSIQKTLSTPSSKLQ